MLLASPLALLALAPWAALAWWLLRGRAPGQAVPFLHLWPRQPAMARVHRRRPPPRFVACALLCLLLAILAAAGPELRLPGLAPARITLVIDRGTTMSAAEGGSTRLAVQLRRLPDLLASAGERVQVTRVQLVPEAVGTSLDYERIANDSAAVPPTAADTVTPLRQAVREALRSGESVVLISDLDPVIEHERLFQLAPARPVRNVAVEGVFVDGAQVLVRLSNAGLDVAGRLMVSSDTALVEREVALGAERPVDVLMRLPAPPEDVVQARFEVDDDWPADNTLVIAREHAWPSVEALPGTPAAVRRMVDVHAELRPPRRHARRIAVGPDASGDVIVAAAAMTSEGAWQVKAHDLTEGVPWESLPELRVAAWPPDERDTWQVLALRGDRPVLAIDTSGAGRRVWVGFDSESLRQSPGFVRFWADVLTWAGGGPERWSHREIPAETLASLTLEAALERAGVAETAGGPVAWNLPRARFPDAPGFDQEAFAAWLDDRREGLRVGPWLLLAALLAAVGAAWWWPRPAAG